MGLRDRWVARKSNIGFPRSGIFHYRRDQDGEQSRIHLRLDPDGHGTLVVNANRVLHLNPTAALMAYLALEKVDQGTAVRTIRKQYRVSGEQALSDLQGISAQLEELVRPEGACPIHDLGLESVAPFSARPTAPYRLDLALTYRCNNDCAHCYNVQHPSPSRSTPVGLPLGDARVRVSIFRKMSAPFCRRLARCVG